MDDLRLNAVAARVVAWHNRNPLARRIAAGQVKSMGYVGFGAVPPLAAEAVQPATPVPAEDAAQHQTAAADSAAEAAAVAAPSAASPSAEAQEVDYEQAFATLAEETAAAESALVPDANSASGAAADVAIDAAVVTAADAATDAATDAAADELAAALAEEAPAAAEAASETDAPPADSAAASAEPEAPFEAAAPAQAEPGTQAQLDATAAETAVLEAPAAEHPQPPPAHAATLRDRVLARAASGETQAEQTAAAAAPVQGALLAAHDGYGGAHATPHHTAQPAADPSYGDNFMAPLSAKAVARWVARHGRALMQPPTDGPLRRASLVMAPTGLLGAAESAPVYVLTAAIEAGSLRSRVLVGAGSSGAVLGARVLSVPRVLAAAGVACTLLAGAAYALAMVLHQPGKHGDTHADHAMPAAHAASAAASVAASAPASAAESGAASSAASAALPAASAATAHEAAHEATHEAAHPGAPSAAPVEHATATPAAGTNAHGAAPAPAPAAAPAAAPATAKPLVMTTERPATAYAQKGKLELPTRGSMLNDEQKAAARQAVADARAAIGRPAATGEASAAHGAAPNLAAATATATGTATAAPVAATSAPSAAAPAPAADVAVFAVSTNPLRTRAEAEQLLAAMSALLRGSGAVGVKLELLPQGEDWRVVALPFTGRSAADAARALLASRGMRVQVLEL
jgi:hypothetical protein